MPRAKNKGTKPYKHPRTKSWTIQISLGTSPAGKRIRKTFTAKTKTAVEAKAEAYLKAHQPTEQSPTGRTVGSFLDEWFDTKKPDWAPRTQELYRHQIDKHIKPRVGGIKLEELAPLDVQRMVNALVKQGVVPTANKCRRLLYSAVKQAVRWELIPKNPVEAVDPVREDVPDTRLWTPAETRRFLDTVKQHRLHPAFHLLVAAGLRRGELLGLRWEDVREGGISIEQTLVMVNNKPRIGAPKTKRSRRFVALDDDTLNLLAEHRRRQRRERDACGKGWTETGLVFTTQVGTYTHPRNLRRVLDTHSQKADVPKASLHSIRHLHASLLIAKGLDAKAISERLGHSSTSFTLDRYGHIFDEHRKKAAVAIAVLLGEEGSDA